jgi:hypothetical protein
VKGTTENLLKNTSFEEKEGGAEEPEEPEIPEVPTYTTEFEDYFYGWERETAIAENGSTIFTCVTDEIAHSGNNSFVLRSLDTGDKDLMIKQTGLGLGEGTYTFSFWATGTVADHDNDSYRYQQIVWLEGLDPSYRYVTDMTTGETEGAWRKYTLEFTVPGGSTVNAIKLSTRGHGTEGLYVDDFSLVKNGTTNNILTGFVSELDGTIPKIEENIIGPWVFVKIDKDNLSKYEFYILTKEEVLALITTSNKWYVTDWNRKLNSKPIVGINVNWLEGEGEEESKTHLKKQHKKYINPLGHNSKDNWEKIINLLL